MDREQIEIALEEISDEQIAESSDPKASAAPLYYIKRLLRRPRTWAAIIAIVLVIRLVASPLALNASAVASADYPDYEWVYRDEMFETSKALSGFFTESMKQTLSGSGSENQTYSPINLYMALCLLAETSDSNQQILELLNAGSREDLRAQANLIWNATYVDKGNQTLLANSVWLDSGLQYNSDVMDILAENYYTDVYKGNLQSQRIGSAIKSWLNGNTGRMLKSDVDDLNVDPMTVMLLYSTVYYQAKWQNEFNKANNTDGKFHAPGGDMDCTYMNKQRMQTSYYWAEDFGAIRLGLKDGSIMWLMLPDEGKTTDDVLASQELRDMIFTKQSQVQENSKYMMVNLSLPKFDIKASGDLKADLQAMGITDVFSSETADFSGTLYDHRDFDDFRPYISAVNQATRVCIDEEGVTAASYIELPMAGAAEPPEEIIDFILDRPFVFVISNRYNLPLFAGVVNEP